MSIDTNDNTLNQGTIKPLTLSPRQVVLHAGQVHVEAYHQDKWFCMQDKYM